MSTFYFIIIIATVLIVLAMLAVMIRSRRLRDKLNAMFVMNTDIVILILMKGVMDGRLDMYVDIALSYSILGFVTTAILAKYIGGRK